jgi:hypothetical protein
MRRCLLAALVLLGAAGLAQAEYILIVVNLNARPEAGQGTTPGMPGAAGGMGMIGGPGGFGPPGSAGAAGGIAGAAGGISPPPAGAAGMGGPRGGGGVYGGMGGMGGAFGGMGGVAAQTDPEEFDDLVVAVLEVQPRTANYIKKFAAGQPISVSHRFGGQIHLYPKNNSYEVIFLEATKGKPLATVRTRFDTRFKDLFQGKEKPDTERVIRDVALWALEHGLTDKCAETMDRLAETDKTHPAVKAYLEVKAALARPLAGGNVAEQWKERLPGAYKVSQTDKHHYALISVLDNPTTYLDRLERGLRNYYYWWALRGVALPVPRERQVAVLAEHSENNADFELLRKRLTASPTLADSFAARREGLSVFSTKRRDAVYDKLTKATKPWWDAAWDRNALLLPGNRGIPREHRNQPQYVDAARTWALLLKALEFEWEQTSSSHEVSRQLLFSSGLLPRNVNAPEWIQFGMGSFFETSLQSPWPTVGGTNPYWQPRFKDFDKKKMYEATPYETLVKVVTDGYFRQKVKAEDKADEKPDQKELRQKKAEEQQLRKARAASWALTYYLASPKSGLLPGLRRYFDELGRQPRDMELDEKTLLACFQKAFAGRDLKDLANSWINFLRTDTLEASDIHNKIREMYAQLNRPRPAQGGPGTNPLMGPAGTGPRGAAGGPRGGR